MRERVDRLLEEGQFALILLVIVIGVVGDPIVDWCVRTRFRLGWYVRRLGDVRRIVTDRACRGARQGFYHVRDFVAVRLRR